MSASTSRLAYQDCYDAYDTALEGPIRLPFDSRGDAMQFKVRLHYARKLDREANAETYEPDHPMHGRSAYDSLRVRVVADGDVTYIYIESPKILHKIERLAAE